MSCCNSSHKESSSTEATTLTGTKAAPMLFTCDIIDTWTTETVTPSTNAGEQLPRIRNQHLRALHLPFVTPSVLFRGRESAEFVLPAGPSGKSVPLRSKKSDKKVSFLFLFRACQESHFPDTFLFCLCLIISLILSHSLSFSHVPHLSHVSHLPLLPHLISLTFHLLFHHVTHPITHFHLHVGLLTVCRDKT